MGCTLSKETSVKEERQPTALKSAPHFGQSEAPAASPLGSGALPTLSKATPDSTSASLTIPVGPRTIQTVSDDHASLSGVQEDEVIVRVPVHEEAVQPAPVPAQGTAGVNQDGVSHASAPALAEASALQPALPAPSHSSGAVAGTGAQPADEVIAPLGPGAVPQPGASASPQPSPRPPKSGPLRSLPSGPSRLGPGVPEPPSQEGPDETMSYTTSEGTSSHTADLDSQALREYQAALKSAQLAGRRLPDRHASMSAIQAQPSSSMPQGLTTHNPPHRTSSLSSQPSNSYPATALSSAGPSIAGTSVPPSANQSAGGTEPEPAPQQPKARPSIRSHPSRLAMQSSQNHRMSFDLGSEYSESAGFPHSAMSLRLNGGPSGSSHSLSVLQKTLEQMMLQDDEVMQKVQSSMRGISSLAKETNNLEVGRDASGATCINQYVVVKTLGRGSFGKVKLCLNTMDGSLYAIKMVNRSFIVKQLQKPAKGLRRRVPARNVSGNTVVSTTASNSAPTAATGVQSVGAQELHGSSLSSTNVGLPSPSSPQGATHTGVTDTAGNPPVRRTDSTNTALHGNGTQCLHTDAANPLEGVMREIAVLKKLDHPNVVKLHEVIDPPGASYMMLVMEYMERGPVMETKGQTGFSSFPERIARDYFRQACAGLDYLHYNNVVHGDLKPENLLVTAAGQLKIGDFGSARMMSDAVASTKVSATPAFQPPEALSNPGSEDPYVADVWALGVCLYCFIFGRLPFTGSCLLDISNAIRNDELKFPAETPISSDLQDLLTKVLCKDPTHRLDLAGVMEHQWVTERGVAPLPSLKALLAPKVEVSRVEAQSAIDSASMVNMLRARLKEKTFNPGEWLFKEGDEAHCIYMIMSGVVEITTRLNGKGVDTSMVDAMEEHSFSVDLDESFTLDCHNLVPSGIDIKDGRLHIDRAQAQALKDRMRTVLLGRQQEYITEVKGPGQVIGDVGMDKSATARHQHSARARDTVTVVKLTEESVLKAIMQQVMEGKEGATPADLLATTEADPVYSSRIIEDGQGSANNISGQRPTIIDSIPDGAILGTL